MSKKIVKVEEKDNYRIIVISDTHGHKDVFNRLLVKVGLVEKDHLIILGDFVNRGIDSYETYQFMRKLSERRNTIILKGNHESFMQRHMVENEYSEKFFEFLKQEYYETLIGTIINKSGGAIESLTSSSEMLSYLEKESGEVQRFLSSLPIMAYFDDMVFVHGGYDEEFIIEEDETKYLKYDNYNELAKPNEKATIVGHWPVSELRDDRLTNLPYFNDEKNIISIDGGLGVKHTGELNAFIIEKCNGQVHYRCVQENDFKKKVVKIEHRFESESLIYLNYPNNEFVVLSKGDEWSKCRHISSGREFRVFTDLLVESENGYRTKTNYINNFLNLEMDDEVELCREFGEYALVKYKDEFGWLMKYQLS